MSQREVATCRDICRYSQGVKSDADRGVFATWLRAQRKAPRPGYPHGWKEPEAVRRLEAAVPGVSFGAYRDIEAGNRKPTDDQRTAIELVFGAIPDFTAGAAVRAGAPADLNAALANQAEAMARMLAFAIQRDQSVEARMRLLEAEVRMLREQLGVEEPPAQSTPPQRGESG